MKGAIAGAVIIWIVLGALYGAVWAFDNYPETSMIVLFGLAATSIGAAYGWVLTR